VKIPYYKRKGSGAYWGPNPIGRDLETGKPIYHKGV
jgi:hypothetical protein